MLKVHIYTAGIIYYISKAIFLASERFSQCSPILNFSSSSRIISAISFKDCLLFVSNSFPKSSAISFKFSGIFSEEISSKKAFRGIIKKASCILAVIIGASLDKLIEGTPINVPISLFNIPLSFKELIIFKSSNVKVNKLSDSFVELFNKAIRIAFKDIDGLYKLFDSYNKSNNEFYDIINFYFEYAEKRICNDLKGKNLYKYFSKDKVSCNRYQVNDGNLSFSPPRSFNDPFDSNCLLSNNDDMSDRFRILCLTHKYNNILMLS